MGKRGKPAMRYICVGAYTRNVKKTVDVIHHMDPARPKGEIIDDVCKLHPLGFVRLLRINSSGKEKVVQYKHIGYSEFNPIEEENIAGVFRLDGRTAKGVNVIENNKPILVRLEK